MKRLIYVLATAIIVFAVIKIIIGISHVSSQLDAMKAQNDIAMAAVDSVLSPDDVTIYYDVRGEGSPALVFVHCWSCDRSYWREQVDEFSQNNTVVSIDLAGHGQSGHNRQDWTIQAFGGDIAAVINNLRLDSVILIGHSMGGMAIVEAARQLPGKVVALIGVDCYNDIGDTYPDEAIEEYLAPLKDSFKSAVYGKTIELFPENADSALRHDVAEDISSAPPGIAIPSYMATIKYIVSEPIEVLAGLKEIQLPVRGINCDLFPQDYDGIKAAAPSIDVRIMSGVGHFLQLENPARFNGLLHETIAELTSATTSD